MRLALFVLFSLVLLGVTRAQDTAPARMGEIKAPADMGVLTGTVKFEGEAPEAFHFDLGACKSDTPVCTGGKETMRASKRLRIDETSRGVGSVVVRLETLEGKAPAPSKPFPAKRRPTLDQVACEFAPFVEWVEAGQSLRLKSSDSVMHNVHAYKNRTGGETLFNVAMPRKDQILTKRMEDPGVAVFGCDAGHLWMAAYVFVVESPYIEITAHDGAFRMDEIPPGTYKVSFWQAGWQVTPGPANAATGKPSSYAYSEPLVQVQTVEVKAGDNKCDVALTKEGWKK